MLDLTDVSRKYVVGDSDVWALRDVSLSLADGEFVSIVGPSGSGKSTLLQIIGLLDRPTSGAITLDGQDLDAMDGEERARLRLITIGFIFQRFHLLNDMTALENVALPMEAVGAGPSERYDRAAFLLGEVGLSERLMFMPRQLSGGQRQRVAVARALANDPKLILADEPTGELHSEDRASIVDLFRRLNSQGRTVVVVTHDMEVAAAAHRRIEIRDGLISRDGLAWRSPA